MLGYYQGAEVVTARALEYAKSKHEILSCARFLVLFLSFSEVQEIKVR